MKNTKKKNQESISNRKQSRSIRTAPSPQQEDLQHTLAELHDTRHKFDLLLRSVPDIVYQLDDTGRIIYVNHVIEEYGHKANHLIGKDFLELVHPEDRIKAKYRVKERRTGDRKTTAFELRLITKRKRAVPFEIKERSVNIDPVFVLNAEGIYSSEKPQAESFLGTIGVARDITERIHAAHVLLYNQERNKTLFDSANDGIFFIDAKKILDCNKKAENILGYHGQDLLGSNFSEYSAPKSKRKMQRLLNQAAQGMDQSLEWVLIRKDGTLFNAEVSLKRVLIAGHYQILGMVRDLTEKQRFEKEIGMLAHAIMSISECVTVIDTDMKILFVNDAFQKTFGYDKTEVIGKPITMIFSGNNPKELTAAVFSQTAQGGWQGEMLSKRKNGNEFQVLFSTSVMRGEQHKPIAFIAVAKEMTEYKFLENQLRQSQKMEAIGILAGGVAHDFNNLLTVIRGYTELLLTKLTISDPLVQSVHQIDKAAERAVALTKQLLAFSRRQIMQPRVINLNHLIREMEKMLRRIIGEDIDFVTDLEVNLDHIKADPGQMEQVIMNIVINARDALAGGGKLTIGTKNVYIDARQAAQYPPMEVGNYACLSIHDTGMGMDKETQAHIFEPFFTTKEKGKGTGLGLATVYGIVKQSGGFIWVHSTPQMGSTFEIYLPLVHEEHAKVSVKSVSHPGLKGKETVLIVEDDDDVRQLLTETLKQYGYTVLHSPDGDSAIITYDRYKDPIHLVLTDVIMPKMSGRELVEKLLIRHAGLKVLYMSGYTDNSIVHRGLLEAGTNFIQKPFTRMEILRKIREVLENE